MEVELADPNHECGQKTTLATICVKLENIEADIKEIKDGQLSFMTGLNEHRTSIARYPSADEVQEADRKLRLHETYFKIIWVALTVAWAALLFVLNKLWN
jgi:hypothetical protein